MQRTFLKYIITISIALITTSVSAQQLKKTLIIDTLIGYSYSKDEFNIPLIRPIPKIGENYLTASSDIAQAIISKSYPNVIFTELDLDSTALLLDNKGGVLKLRSIQSFAADTIRINKWIVYENGLTDSLFTSKAFFRMYNDSMAETPYKTEQTHCLIKHKGERKIKHIDITINDKHYNISVSTVAAVPTSFSDFHGYKPRGKYKSYMQNASANKKTFRYTRFMGQNTLLIQLYDASINL